MRHHFVKVAALALGLTLLLCAIPANAQSFSQPKPKKGPKYAASAAKWAPADVDDQTPAVTAGVECSLPEVMQRASGRVTELVSNLPDFTATERLEHHELQTDGAWGPPETKVFKYLLELRENPKGMLRSEETRDGTKSLQIFPGGLADIGLPVLALAFHPYFVGDYTMTCEGQGEWEGTPAWLVSFRQRPDRPPRLRAFVVGQQTFPLRLKGRAWISAESYQLLHLESDLLQTVPLIQLLREHLAVDYRPVRFKQHNVELWLPQTAEVHMDFRGHRYRRRHTFSDFLLFAVDMNQKIIEPKEQ